MRAWIWLGHSTFAADNAKVDDDQRHSTLLLGLLPGRLLESGPLLRRLLEEMKAGKLENFCAA